MTTFRIQRRVSPLPNGPRAVSGPFVGNLDWHEAPQSHAAYTSLDAAIGYLRELHRRGETDGYEWRVRDSRARARTWTQNVHLWPREDAEAKVYELRIRRESDGSLRKSQTYAGRYTLAQAQERIAQLTSSREYVIVHVTETEIPYVPPPRDYPLSDYIVARNLDGIDDARWHREGTDLVVTLACGDHVRINLPKLYGSWTARPA